jgi:gallate dioxygenase
LARAHSLRRHLLHLEKLAAAVGVPNQQIYAAMRGESLEDFQKTRKTQVLYSVAGTHERKQ